MNLTVIDTTNGREYWTAAQCSAHCGVAKSTFAAYATRGQAPTVVARFDGRTPLWDAEEVKTWHAARPSRQAD